MESTRSLPLQPSQHQLEYVGFEKSDERAIFYIKLDGVDYKCTILQKNIMFLSEEKLKARFDREIVKLVKLAQIVDLKVGESFVKKKDVFSLQGREDESEIITYKFSDKVKLKLPASVGNKLEAISNVFKDEMRELSAVSGRTDIASSSKPKSKKIKNDSSDETEEVTLEIDNHIPDNVRDDNALKAKNLEDKGIHFIGAVARPDVSWDGEKGKEKGKELWQERYGFETISIWPHDNKGKPSVDDTTGRPIELHIYATTLKPYYDEWENKLANGEIIRDNEKRFDGYIAQKMVDDPQFKEDIVKENVRFFSPEELKRVEGHFMLTEKGIQIQQVGLDSPGGSLKELPKGEYAFVIGRKHGRSTKEEEINYFDDSMAIYLSPKNHTDKGMIQHSSFFRGGKVASAGMIDIDAKGKIATVTQYSGHYLPSHEEMAVALRFLQRNLEKKYFDSIMVSINYFDSGIGLMSTMAINAIVKKQFNKKLDLGMVVSPAHEWLNDYNFKNKIL